MKKFYTEFKEFITKGNVLDLAVAVIIGGAFGKIVTSLVNDLIMPLLGLVLGGINLTSLKYVIKPATATTAEAAIKYGSFLQSVIDFLIIAFCIFLFVKLASSMKRKKPVALEPTPQPVPTDEVLLLREIRDLLKDK